MFHRLGVPSYFIAGGGSLPPGYDYINNAGSGTPSLAGSAKVGGPNAGTYFIAFGEDATSEDANRPAKALAENTDILDNYFHRDLAVPKVTTDVTAVAPVNSFQLVDTQGIFVGVAGTPNNANGINTFVEILDSNNNEIIGDSATGARSRVTAISGATVGTGFAGAGVPVTFTVSPPIPSGTVYRIVYGVRGNLSTISTDALSFVQIRGAQERDAATLDFENQVSRRSGQNVDALVASILETPNGVRRPQSGTMSFDIDPADTQASGVRGFNFRRSRDATAALLAKLVEDPTDPDGFIRRFQLGAGGLTGVGSGGPVTLFDANIIAAGTAAGLPTHIPLSGSLAADGDNYIRLAEHVASPSAPTRSIIKALNARYYVTVGDGASTFGDFNGVNAVQNALAAYLGFGSVLHIRIKAGTYTLSGTGGSGFTVPTGTILILEGDDRDVCIVEAATGDGQTFKVTGGRLVLSGVQLRLKALSTQGGIYVSGTDSRVNIFSSSVIQQKLVYTNTTPRPQLGVNVEPIVREDPQLAVDNSILDMDGIVDSLGVYPLLHILVNDDQEHRDWVIKNSVLRCCDNNSPVKIEALDNTLTNTRVRNVFFLNCRILLASTFDNGTTNVQGNTGMCWFEPLNTVNALRVDNIVWRGCDVWANWTGAGAVSMVLHAVPPSIRFNGTTQVGKTLLGRIEVSDSNCYLPDVDTAFLPFAILSQRVRVQNVRLRTTKELNGKVPASFLAYAPSAANTAPLWGTASFQLLQTTDNSAAAGIFAPGRVVFVQNLYVSNVRQAGSHIANGTADIAINTSGADAFIDNVRVVSAVGGAATSSGQKPTYRIYVAGSQQPSSTFREIVFDGVNATGASPNTWVASGGYMMFIGGGNGVSEFQRCGVVNASGSTQSDGIKVDTGNFRIIECFAKGCANGLTLGITGSAGTTCQIIGGDYSLNTGRGIYASMAASLDFNISLHGVRCYSNTDVGLEFTAPESAWSIGGFTGRPSTLNVTGCMFQWNNGGAYVQTKVIVTSTSLNTGPHGVWVGNMLNHLQADVGPGEAQFLKNGSTSFGGELGNMKGLVNVAAGTNTNTYNFQVTRNGP